MLLMPGWRVACISTYNRPTFKYWKNKVFQAIHSRKMFGFNITHEAIMS